MFRRVTYFDITEEPLDDELALEQLRDEPPAAAVALEDARQAAPVARVLEHDGDSRVASAPGRGSVATRRPSFEAQPEPALLEAPVDRGVEARQVDGELEALLAAVPVAEPCEPQAALEALQEAQRTARGADRAGEAPEPHTPVPAEPSKPAGPVSTPPAPHPATHQGAPVVRRRRPGPGADRRPRPLHPACRRWGR